VVHNDKASNALVTVQVWKKAIDRLRLGHHDHRHGTVSVCMSQCIDV